MTSNIIIWNTKYFNYARETGYRLIAMSFLFDFFFHFDIETKSYLLPAWMVSYRTSNPDFGVDQEVDSFLFFVRFSEKIVTIDKDWQSYEPKIVQISCCIIIGLYLRRTTVKWWISPSDNIIIYSFKKHQKYAIFS